MTTPRRHARSRSAVVRAPVYAWLEEIKFRTGMTVLVALGGIVVGAIATGVLLAAAGGASRPAAGPRSLEQRAAVATPMATATPSATPMRRSRKPPPTRKPSHRADSTGTATDQEAAQPVPAAPPPAPHPQDGHHSHPGWPHPGWPHSGWPHTGWPHSHGWPGHPGWPPPQGWPGRGHGDGWQHGQGHWR